MNVKILGRFSPEFVLLFVEGERERKGETREREGERMRGTATSSTAAAAVAVAVAVAVLLCFEVAGVAADASDHRYKPEDPVPLYANKVGPFQNPR